MAHWYLPKFHNYFTITLLVILKHTKAYMNEKPCHYLDTINITDGSYNEIDGSRTFEGINYNISLYATYDYEVVEDPHRRPTIPHFRGCTCKLKPCVRMCCPRGQYLYNKHCHANDSVLYISVPVTNDGKHFIEEEIFNIFNYVVGKPCPKIAAMEPEKYPDTDTWVLFRVSYYYLIILKTVE